MKQNLIFILIIFFSTVYCTTTDQCSSFSDTDCETCINANVSNCAFCSNNKICFPYTQIASDRPCGVSDMQWQTCVGICGFELEMIEYYLGFRVWIIIVAVLAGVILLAVIIVICCLCRKCKKCRIRKEERRQAVDDQRMAERRAEAEVRTAERNKVADQIRMKYGILKEKDNGTDYTRMS